MYSPYSENPELEANPELETELEELQPLAAALSPNGSGLDEKADVPHPDEVPSHSHQEKHFHFLRLDDILELPQNEWLVEQFLPAKGISLLTAAPAVGKSFLALDLMYCVANGLPWHGYPIKQGLVVYIVAEGFIGLGDRLKGFLQHYGQGTADNLWFYSKPIQFSDSKTLALFAKEVAPLNPVLIIFDTLAKCMANMNEDNPHMNRVVHEAEDIVNKTGAHVMIVHHNTKNGDDYRGGSALPGGVDTHIAMQGDGNQVTLKTKKQKYAPEHPPLTFEKKIIVIQNTPSQNGSVPTSLVFELVESSDDSSGSSNLSSSSSWGKLKGLKKQLFQILVDGFENDGATTGQWWDACPATGISRRSYNRAREELVEMGAVVAKDRDGQTISKADLDAMSTKEKAAVVYFPKP